MFPVTVEYFNIRISYNLVIHLPADGHLCYFQMAIENKPAMKTQIQNLHFSWLKYSGMRNYGLILKNIHLS